MTQAWMIANRYEVGPLIGAGGMGTVYRGRDRQTTETIAIKVLRPDAIASDPTVLERFQRESDALRRLNHPNIVKILDEIEENQQHYIVMEYVSGGSLADQLVGRAGLPITEVLEIALDLADALTRAHRLRIIHRDLKPQNVLLADDGTPRLTDFGVAQMQDQQRMTQSGMILGTISYLSPEACDGAAADERTDIWAFGVMLYEMLTGQRPFDEGSTVATLTAIMQKPLPPLADLRPDTPPALVQLIEGMLQKDPSDRIGSVRQIGADIETIIRSLDHDMIESSVELRRTADDLQISRFDTPSGPVEVFELDFAGSPSKLAGTPLQKSTAAVPYQGDHAPRVFVSYRSDDSGHVAGQITERLGMAFGDGNVLHDIDRLSLRTVSRLVLAQDTVGASDALVVVIGPGWMGGIDNPKNPVRQEVEIGLKKPDMVVLPLLVNGASLPGRADLPPSLGALADAQPLPVRQGQFDADMARVVERLQRRLGIQTGLRFPYPLLAIIALALLVVGGFAGASMLLSHLAPVEVLSVPPVEDGELMVLIADIPPGDPTAPDRDFARLIAASLTGQLRRADPFSTIRLRNYPAPIESERAARQIAAANRAAVVIWGEATPDGLDLMIGAGSASGLPNTPFDDDVLSDTATLHVRVPEPESDTLIQPLLSVVASLHIADGDGYNALRTVALLNALPPGAVVIVEDGRLAEPLVAVQRQFLRDTEAALAQLDAALTADPDNAIVRAYQVWALLRLGRLDEARVILNEADTSGLDEWTTVHYLRASDALLRGGVEAAIDEYSTIVRLRPGDWFPLNYRAALYYIDEQYAEAEADFERVIELQPDANFAYAFLTLMALRDGRINEALTLRQAIQPGRADELIANLITEVGGADSDTVIFSAIFAAFVNLLSGDDEAVLAAVEAAQAINPRLVDLYLLEGLAECRQGDHAAADAAYSRGIDLDPDYAVLYLLRAQSRIELGQRIGVIATLQTLRQSNAELSRLAREMSRNGVDCTNFFEPRQ